MPRLSKVVYMKHRALSPMMKSDEIIQEIVASEEEKPLKDYEEIVTVSPKYEGYLFDVTLKISFYSDDLDSPVAITATVATVVIQIIHKYNFLQLAAFNIFDGLQSKVFNNLNKNPESNKSQWDISISTCGYDFTQNFIEEFPIIYDSLALTGAFECSTSLPWLNGNHVSRIAVTYTSTFFLTPALAAAMPYYKSRGFRQSKPSLYCSPDDFSLILNVVEYNKDYNYKKVWKTAYKVFENLPVNEI